MTGLEAAPIAEIARNLIDQSQERVPAARPESRKTHAETAEHPGQKIRTAPTKRRRRAAPALPTPPEAPTAETARALRWRIEAACDGYAALAYDDVPAEWCYDADAFMAGAAAAAEAIRQVTSPPASTDGESDA